MIKRSRPVGTAHASEVPRMPSPTQRWGAARETLAEEALAREGYVVIERNWRLALGEIDRIAWEGDVLCFIEVRARATDLFGIPAATVNRAKQRRLIRAAAAYLARFSPGARPMARFDVVSIVDRGRGSADITVIRNAFDAGQGV